MSLLLENYQDQQARLPSTGQHLCAQFTADDIIVYQAYQPGIADFAVKEWILEIIDVTNFAKQQYSVLSESGLEGLEVPVENVFPLDQYPLIQQRLGAD